MTDRGHADPVAQKEINRLRAGEDRTPVEEMTWPTAGQAWHRMLEYGEQDRLAYLRMLLQSAQVAQRCVQADHRALADENADLRGRLAATNEILDHWALAVRETVTDMSEVAQAFERLSPEAQQAVLSINEEGHAS